MSPEERELAIDRWLDDATDAVIAADAKAARREQHDWGRVAASLVGLLEQRLRLDGRLPEIAP